LIEEKNKLFIFYIIIALLKYKKNVFVNFDQTNLLSYFAKIKIQDKYELNDIINLSKIIKNNTPKSFEILVEKLEIFKPNSLYLKYNYEFYNIETLLTLPLLTNEILYKIYENKEIFCYDKNCKNFSLFSKENFKLENEKENECKFCKNKIKEEEKINFYFIDLRLLDLNNNNKNKNNNKDSNSNKKDNKLISINKIQVIKNYNSSNAYKNINKNLTNIKNYIKFHINNNNNNNNSKNNNNNKKENILIKNRNNNTLNYNNFKKNQTLKSFSVKKNLLNNNNNIFNNINNHIFEHNNNKNFTNRKKENKTKNNKNVNEIVNKKIPKINKLNYSSKKPFYSLKINKEQKINSPQIEVFPIKKEMMNSIFSSVPKKEASVEEFTMNDSLLNSIKEDEKLNINEFNDNNLICNENKPFVYIKI
jgi:hypothetical protein